MVAAALAAEKEKEAVIKRQGLRDDLANELADVSTVYDSVEHPPGDSVKVSERAITRCGIR